MALSSLKVGIIGAGWFADVAHIPGFQSHPEVEVVALCSRSHASVQALAEKHRIPLVYTDYHELLRLKELDLVSVATPNDLHHPITIAALEAGKHVLCEKPLALNAMLAKEMLDQANDADLKHMVAFTWQFTPAAQRMKEMIEAGFLGKIYHINALYANNSLNAPLTWRYRRESAGSGALGDIGSHAIQLARWWLGEVSQVCGHLETHIRQRPSVTVGRLDDVTVDDSAAFLARFENGAQGIFHATKLVSGRGNFLRLEISGSQGALILELETRGSSPHMNLWSSSRESRDLELVGLDTPSSVTLIRERPSMGEPEIFASLFARLAGEFVRAISIGEAATPNFYDGWRVQQVLDALLRSAHAGQWASVR